MKIKKTNLQYWVFRIENGNIERFNILEGYAPIIAKNIKSSINSYNHINNRLTLKEFLRKDFMYHYWSKAEMEYLICDLFYKNRFKFDVWYQIEPNLDLIVDYIVKEMELGKNYE